MLVKIRSEVRKTHQKALKRQTDRQKTVCANVNIRSSHVAFLTHYPLTFAFLSTFLPPALETRRVFCYIVSMATSQQLQSAPGSTCVSTKDDAATPFSRNTIELTQQEYIELKSAANYWRSMHLRLKEKYDRLREDCRCEQKDRTIRKLSEQLEEVPALLSLVDQLQRMVFGRRTEKSRVRCKPQVGAGNDSEDASKKTRGQRKGSKGPGARGGGICRQRRSFAMLRMMRRCAGIAARPTRSCRSRRTRRSLK